MARWLLDIVLERSLQGGGGAASFFISTKVKRVRGTGAATVVVVSSVENRMRDIGSGIDDRVEGLQMLLKPPIGKVPLRRLNVELILIGSCDGAVEETR